MKKARAIELLGGTVTTAAAAVGVTPSAVSQWPDDLPRRLEDRVLAALARRGLAEQSSVVDARGRSQAPIEPA